MKFVKYGAIILVVLLVLLVAGAIFIATTINPNNYKPQISKQVQQITGRSFTINGDIEWSFFPWLGLRANQIVLGNAPDFPQTEFASVAQADFQVKLLPLMTGQIELGKLTLIDPNIRLMTKATGENNWDDLAKGKTAETSKAPSTDTTTTQNDKKSANKPVNLNISSLEISNANVSWDNLATNRTIEVQEFNLSGNNIGINESFPLNMNFKLKGSNPNISGKLSVKSKFVLNHNQRLYQLPSVLITGNFYQANMPKASNFVLEGNGEIDLADNKFELNVTNSKMNNLDATGQITATSLNQNPKFAGNLNIASFNMRNWLDSLGIHLSKMNNHDALTAAALSSTFTLENKTLSINKLTMSLDQSQLTGKIVFNTLNNINFDLNVNSINFDDYIPVATPKAENENRGIIKTAYAASKSETNPLPMNYLRQLTINGSLNVDKVQAAKAQLNKLSLKINGKNGIINLKPISAQLYQGSFNATATADFRGDLPRWTLTEDLSSVQINPLLKDVANTSNVAGIANIQSQITSTGFNKAAFLRNLNGSSHIEINNGEFIGVDLLALITLANNIADQHSLSTQTSSTGSTEFGTITANFAINNGVMSTNNLELTSPVLACQGKGSVNLPTEYLDFDLNVSAKGNQIPANVIKLQDQIGGSLPVKVKGPFSKPQASLDPKAILTALAKSKAQKFLDEAGVSIESGSKDAGKQIKDAFDSMFR